MQGFPIGGKYIHQQYSCTKNDCLKVKPITPYYTIGLRTDFGRMLFAIAFDTNIQTFKI